jgi:hypothetical protein
MFTLLILGYHQNGNCKIGIETAKQTLKSTTQHGVRQAIHPLRRKFRVDHIDINCRCIRDMFYMDTLFSKVKSVNGNIKKRCEFTILSPISSTNVAGRPILGSP